MKTKVLLSQAYILSILVTKTFKLFSFQIILTLSVPGEGH